MIDRTNSIILTNDTSADNAIFEYFMNFDEFYHSALTIVLQKDEGADRLFSVMFLAQDKNQYTNDHAHILALFRPVLENLLLNFAQSAAEPYLLLTRERTSLATPETLLRRCGGLNRVMRLVDSVAAKNSTVLLCGASGTGKELVAETMHALSSRRNGPLVKINCGSIPETLIDSELFGHEKGAFTGADATRPGYFEQAQGGTLYLDEIGELTAPAQIRLLRVLENREIRRVGGNRRIPIDVRVIAATHRDLRGMVQDGSFREDLWYRLNVFPIDIPPLARRLQDIPILVEHFYQLQVADQRIAQPPRLNRRLIIDLMSREWPGNVRELRYVMERALLTSDAAGHAELQLAEQDRLSPRRRTRKFLPMPPMSSEQVLDALNRAGGRIQGADGAAAQLGISPSTLRSRMKKMGIPLPRQRRG